MFINFTREQTSSQLFTTIDSPFTKDRKKRERDPSVSHRLAHNEMAWRPCVDVSPKFPPNPLLKDIKTNTKSVERSTKSVPVVTAFQVVISGTGATIAIVVAGYSDIGSISGVVVLKVLILPGGWPLCLPVACRLVDRRNGRGRL